MQFGKSVESRLKLKVRKFHKSQFRNCGDMGKNYELSYCPLAQTILILAMQFVAHNFFKGDSFFHSDEQPELNLKNDYPNKTGPNLKANSSISIL